MKTTSSMLAALLTLTLASCSTLGLISPASGPPATHGEVPNISVTIEQLLVNPSAYYGKHIDLVGSWDKGTLNTSTDLNLAIVYGGTDKTAVLLSTKEPRILYATLLLKKGELVRLGDVLQFENHPVLVHDVEVMWSVQGIILEPREHFGLEISQEAFQ